MCGCQPSISERAQLAYSSMRNGRQKIDVIRECGFETEYQYQHALSVTKHACPAVVQAMNDGVISIGTAHRLRHNKGADIVSILEKHYARKHKQITMTDKRHCDLFLELLDRTWVDWKAFRQNVGLCSPGDKLKAIRQLVPLVREEVNTLLDEMEKRCLPKTLEPKTC